jgi:hypothetical protein
MIDGNIQLDLFRAAKEAGESAGFEIIYVVVFDNEIQYTWERSGRKTLRHQFAASINELESAHNPLALIEYMFLRQTRAMRQFRETHEQP